MARNKGSNEAGSAAANEGGRRGGKIQDSIEAVIDLFNTESEAPLIRTNGDFYEYRNGAWDVLSTATQLEGLRSRLYTASLDADFDFAVRSRQVMETLCYRSQQPADTLDQTVHIACSNGTLDVENECLVPHSPQHYTTRRVPFEYIPDAQCPKWLKFLRRMLEHPERTPADVDAMIAFLQQWIGVNIVGPTAKRNRHLRPGLIIDGISGTGKSTFASVVRALFTPDKVVSLKMSALSETFGPAALIGAHAWISDDGISVGSKADVGVLKGLVTGEPMTLNRKFLPPVEAAYDGAILFTTNVLPRLRDQTEAIYNRLMVVKMDRVFTAADAKKDLQGHKSVVDFLQHHNEFPGILNWALDGYSTAVQQGWWDKPAELQDASVAFRRSNDPTFAFVTDHVVPDANSMINMTALAWAVAYFSLSEHGIKASPQECVSSLRKTVRECVPGCQIQRAGAEEYIIGAKVKGTGLLLWEAARAQANGGITVKEINGRRL